MGQKWSKIDHLGLAYHVTREARKALSLDLNVLDLLRQENGKHEIVKVIYNTLLERRVQYALEPRATEKPKPTQEIRTPSEILESLREGTCLDLALLVCGVCLACELIPILIILDGHALVAVSLNHGMYEWDRRGRNEDGLFKNALVTEEKAEQLLQLIEDGYYLPLECTGAAYSQSLSGKTPEGTGRGPDGTLTFERAVEAGRQQFDPQYGRRFLYAIDVAVAHCFHEMEPVPSAQVTGRPPPGDEQQKQPHKNKGSYNPLPYLLDRSKQEKALRRAALYHRVRARRRPLVCVIHGDEYECHSDFVIRLKDISLPRIIEYWEPGKTRQNSVSKYRMKFPLESLDDSNWEGMLWEELAEATTGDPHSPRERVVSFVSQHKLAVMLDVSLLAQRLEGTTPGRIDLLFKFWENWPDLPEGLLLGVFLSVKYQRRKERRPSWFRSLLGAQSASDKLRGYVAKLDFERFPKLYGVTLPELCAIPQGDADDAVNHPLVSEYYGFSESGAPRIGESDVRRIYERTELCLPDGCMPMDFLLQQFNEVSTGRRV